MTKPAAALDNGGRTICKACAALMAETGGRRFDAHTVRSDVTQDRVVPASPMVPAVESRTSPFTPPCTTPGAVAQAQPLRGQIVHFAEKSSYTEYGFSSDARQVAPGRRTAPASRGTPYMDGEIPHRRDERSRRLDKADLVAQRQLRCKLLIIKGNF